jgi:hypothetical protein
MRRLITRFPCTCPCKVVLRLPALANFHLLFLYPASQYCLALCHRNEGSLGLSLLIYLTHCIVQHIGVTGLGRLPGSSRFDSFFTRDAGYDLCRCRRREPAARGYYACFGCAATDTAVVLFHGRNGFLTREFRDRGMDTLALYGYCHHHSSRRRGVRSPSCPPSLSPLTDFWPRRPKSR